MELLGSPSVQANRDVILTPSLNQWFGPKNSEVTVLEPGLPLLTMIAANVIMSIASVLQASVGIGLALLAVPLLALVALRHV